MQRWNFKAALAGLAARNFKAASKILAQNFGVRQNLKNA
ncbi:hypothetical protein CAMGR0001_0351 [Campylobacter gracilis RM3268]|uniref:Uncharacterized protein n=1 Tax=Campylobacter gracilis RM3268 TaxID=553220 RepID=C8PKX8_9BACT|nr:hypothetical protein CAMGR0001_0351 [Campylobacter gracilis RM3268]